MTMDASHSVCYNIGDLIFSKNRIYFVLEDKLSPGFYKTSGFFWSEENVSLNIISH